MGRLSVCGAPGLARLGAGVNPIFEPNPSQVGRQLAEPALLFPWYEDNPHLARVAPAQQLLFPASPRALCQEMGLNWLAALKLHEEGWLSFSPEHTHQLDEAQEAELRFVGSLVLGGCDRNMLALLLGALPKPYAYDPQRLYYDWATRRWRLLPEPQTNPEAVFADWLEALVETRDVSTISGIDELARDALARIHLRSSNLPQRTYSPQHRVTTDEEETRG